VRRALLLTVSFAALAVAIAACAKPKVSGSLTSGVYEISGYRSVIDGCANNFVDPAAADGLQVVVLVDTHASPEPVSIGVAAGEISGVSLTAASIVPYDWAPKGYDCREKDTYTWQGTVTGDGTFKASYTTLWEESAGTQCTEAYQSYSDTVGQTVTLPCNSVAKFRLTRVGPPPPPPQPITGVVTTASGFHAIAALTASSSAGTGFVLDATLGGIAVTSTGGWSCFAPDPAHGVYDYQLSVPGTFLLTVTTAAWTEGPHAIDGSSVALTVRDGSRYGDATGGTVVIDSAGTLAGPQRACRFGMAGVPLSGYSGFVPAHPDVRFLR
jgi:hypothetical protein